MTRTEQQASTNRAMNKLTLVAQLQGTGVQLEANPSMMGGSNIVTTVASDPEDQQLIEQLKANVQAKSNAAALAEIDLGVQKLASQARALLADIPEPPTP